MQFAKSARCIYTRYADDLTFSSQQPPTALFDGNVPSPSRFSPDLLKPELRSIIESNGFTLNPEKAHYADRNSRRMVTGLKVNEIVNVDRRYVRNLEGCLALRADVRTRGGPGEIRQSVRRQVELGGSHSR